MAEQILMSEAIVKAVAEATRIAIQMMAEMQAQRSESQWGPKLGGPVLIQPQFNWEAVDKYTEWKAFILEVQDVLSTHNAQEQDKIAIAKNWLGRKGLRYKESLAEVEKEACNTIQGLFDTLAEKFRPQFNETIKSLQFRKLYRFEGKSAEEWIGRLCMAVAECNYRDLDHQLKEQFIHGLNDKAMLEEVIRELTAKNNNEQTTSQGVLAWVKRVGTQRAQEAILNDITESCQFDKIKMAPKAKGDQAKQMQNTASSRWSCRYCGRITSAPTVPSNGKMCAGCGKMRHYKKGVQKQKGPHGA